METEPGVNEKILNVLYSSTKRALSPQEVADRVGDYSRQYIDRRLRNMAQGDGDVERLELGPAVGYYWKYDEIEMLDGVFEDWAMTRGTVHSPHPVLCMSCDRKLSAGDDLIIAFERINRSWNDYHACCMNHIDQNSSESILRKVFPEEYLSEGLSDSSMAFAAVHGRLFQEHFVDRENDRLMSTHTIKDAAVLEFTRSIEFSPAYERSTE